jgi:hypothetical protein
MSRWTENYQWKLRIIRIAAFGIDPGVRGRYPEFNLKRASTAMTST